MTVYATQNAVTAAAMRGSVEIRDNDVISACADTNSNAPVIAGMERRKENRVDSFLEKPTSRPAAIVIPDRDTPGNSESV